jgi:hypothetical protein
MAKPSVDTTSYAQSSSRTHEIRQEHASPALIYSVTVLVTSIAKLIKPTIDAVKLNGSIFLEKEGHRRSQTWIQSRDRFQELLSSTG